MAAAGKKKTKPAAKAVKKPVPAKKKAPPKGKKPAPKPVVPARTAAPVRAADKAKGVAAPARPALPASGAAPKASEAKAGARPGTLPPGTATAGTAKGTGPATAKGVAPGGPGKGGPAGVPRPATPGRPAGKKSTRKSSLANRRGPNGEPFVPGDLLIPLGAQGPDEIQYLLRGSVAAEHAAAPAAVSEIILKKGTPEAEADREDLNRYAEGMAERFEKGAIEPLLPTRGPSKRNFAGVVERAKHRRREIGAFLRGLDLGRTETSHMDSHGEASLQSLMEWAARLENLAEADEPDQADYAQFHRGLDQLDNTTETLIVDVELTLRRLRDRVRS